MSDKKRLEEIKELLDDNWFADNPNGDDIKDEIDFLFNTIAALEAKLAECVAALEAADFVLQGSRAIPGQSDKTLDKREAALWFFLETLAKVKK